MPIVESNTTTRRFALVTFVNTAKGADNHNLLMKARSVDNSSVVALRRTDIACDGVRYRAIETKCAQFLFYAFECFASLAVVYPLIDVAYFPGATTDIYRLARQVESVPYEENYVALYDCSDSVNVERGAVQKSLHVIYLFRRLFRASANCRLCTNAAYDTKTTNAAGAKSH